MPVISGHGISNTEIAHLEQQFAVHFPESYKIFLSVYNGFVVTSPDYCDLLCDDVDDHSIAFYCLFGVNVSNENNDLISQNQEFLDELSFIKQAFIIGDDPGGNYFVLICNADQRGVYYWDRTHLHAHDDCQQFSIAEINECGNLYKIYHDFSEFFATLIQKTVESGMILQQVN